NRMLDHWTSELAATIAAAVREFAPIVRGQSIALLAVDCHPWHGLITLAVLTQAEVAADEMLTNPAEMAAWRHYHFTGGLAWWQRAAALGRAMRAAYEAAGDRGRVAEAFLRACARAMTAPQVAESVELLVRAGSFRVSVSHPDDGREFVPPDGGVRG